MNITRALATSLFIASIILCLAETGLQRQVGTASAQLTSYSTVTSYETTTLQITRVTTSFRIQYVTSTTNEYSGNYVAVRVYYSGVMVRNIGSERIEEGIVALRKPRGGDILWTSPA